MPADVKKRQGSPCPAKYTATIATPDKEKFIAQCFAAEDKGIKEGKAQYTVQEKEGVTFFEIIAQDSISLRTIINSITKMLTVIEKTTRIPK